MTLMGGLLITAWVGRAIWGGGQLFPQAFLRREERDGAVVRGEMGSRGGSFSRMGEICKLAGGIQNFFQRVAILPKVQPARQGDGNGY